jgi:hypothetical protein
VDDTKPDTTGAETYADALEEASRQEISIRLARVHKGSDVAIAFFATIFVFVVIAFITPNPTMNLFFIAMPFVGGVTVLTWFLSGYYNSIELKDGRLMFRRAFIPFMKTNLAEVLWIGFGSESRYIYLTRGRRKKIPFPSRSMAHRHGDSKLFGILLDLSEIRAREKADEHIESDIPVPIPLSEGATYRRLPGLATGLLLTLPIGGLITFSGFGLFLTGFRENEDGMIIFGCLFIPLGLYVLYRFFSGLRRMFIAYVKSKEQFTPEGILAKKAQLFPYENLEIALYRGVGGIDDPCPGIIEIFREGEKPAYIGSERENYFILPYLLKKWASDNFVIRPLAGAPAKVQKLLYSDTL